MELRTLRYFVVLAEELHFGRAAQRLAITQPPLSLAIRGLEDELGVILLARTRRRVALTHAGSTFLEQARGILARTAEAVQLAQAADRGDVGRLTIGFMSASIFTLLPAVLREFAARHPGVRLDLRELTLPQQIAALRSGNLDAGFVRPPVTDADLTATPLLEEPLRVALPAGHRLTASKRVRAAELAGEPFVTFQRAPASCSTIWCSASACSRDSRHASRRRRARRTPSSDSCRPASAWRWCPASAGSDPPARRRVPAARREIAAGGYLPRLATRRQFAGAARLRRNSKTGRAPSQAHHRRTLTLLLPPQQVAEPFEHLIDGRRPGAAGRAAQQQLGRDRRPVDGVRRLSMVRRS